MSVHGVGDHRVQYFIDTSILKQVVFRIQFLIPSLILLQGYLNVIVLFKPKQRQAFHLVVNLPVLLIMPRLLNQQLLKGTEALRVLWVLTVSIQVDVVLGGVDDHSGRLKCHLNTIPVSLNSQDAVLLALHFIPPATLTPPADQVFTLFECGVEDNWLAHVRLNEVTEEPSLLHWNVFDHLVTFNLKIQV
jgi:hypothetical protein